MALLAYPFLVLAVTGFVAVLIVHVAALRGCPKWLQRAQWILFGYTWVGFFALPIIYGGSDLPINKARSMSGMPLAFYSIAASVLYSARTTQGSNIRNSQGKRRMLLKT